MTSPGGSPPPAVQAQGLHYSYKGKPYKGKRKGGPSRPALAGIDFSVSAGEIFGFLGPNGGGKTTLFRILATLARPDAGTVSILGADLGTQAVEVRRRLGVVFQNPSLDLQLTVRENLVHQGQLYGLSGMELAARTAAALNRFGLGDRAGQKTLELSGGLRRRVEIAKALLHAPRLLLLDEPSTGLDPGARRDLWETLESLRIEGVTVLLTTHFMEEGDRCGRLVLLDRGAIVAEGSPAALKEEIGGDVITVTGPEPEALARDLAARFPDLGPTLSDGTVRILRERGHELVRPPGRGPAGADRLRHRGPAQPGRRLPAPHRPPSLQRRRGRRLTMKIMLAVYTLWRRELTRFFRQPSRIAGAVATPLIFWLLLGSGLSGSFRLPGGPESVDYLEYFFPGTIVLVLLFAAIFSNISVIEDRHEGFLQGVLVAPVGRATLVAGKVLGGSTLAWLQAIVFLALAPAAGIHLTFWNLLAAAGVLAVLAVALSALGFAFAWKLDSVQGFHAIMNIVLMPMWMLSGAFFPASGAPGWLAALMRFNPLTYGIAALRHAFYGAALEEGMPGVALSLAVTLAVGLASFASCLLATRGARVE